MIGIVETGGEGGIRTLGTGVSPYNGLANRRIRPLCHLSACKAVRVVARGSFLPDPQPFRLAVHDGHFDVEVRFSASYTAHAPLRAPKRILQPACGGQGRNWVSLR
jgi:hypothetical protein